MLRTNQKSVGCSYNSHATIVPISTSCPADNAAYKLHTIGVDVRVQPMILDEVRTKGTSQSRVYFPLTELMNWARPFL